MDSSPFTQTQIEQFVAKQKDAFLNSFVDYPNYYPDPLNSWFKITNQTYRHSPGMVSILFKMATFDGGAHPWTTIETQTFDIPSRKLIGIQDIFRDGVDPVSVLAPLVSASLKQQYGNDGIVQDVDPQATKNLQVEAYGHFAIDATTLYLFFPPGREGPLPAGGVTVKIPLSSLAGQLKADGSIGDSGR
jgi:hypothetical protein